MRNATITLAQAAQWCGGSVSPEYADRAFHGAHIDSREISAGELFVCVRAERNGHAYARAAMENGAAAVLASEPLAADIPAVYVADTVLALQEIARCYRETLACKVIGITGSVGKTTTKEMLAAVLSERFRVVKTEKNFNNELGLPLMLLRLRPETDCAVLEMGMNHFGELSRMTRLAQPEIALITNIGTMHIEYLGSREGILQAKLELLEGLREGGTVFFNGDDDLLCAAAAAQHAFTFGRGASCAVRAENICVATEQTSFTANAAGNRIPIVLPVSGAHYVSDALAAVAVGLYCGVTPKEVQNALSGFQNTAHRQTRIDRFGLHILDDSYNAGPESMRAALNTLSLQSGRKIAVLGGMLELGALAPQAHYEIGMCAAANAQLLFAYGENSEYYVEGAKHAGIAYAACFPTHDALYQQLRATLQCGDSLLFKGSHGMHMEQVLERLLKDGIIGGTANE